MSGPLGVFGAGKLGLALAKTALARGLQVWLTSRNLVNTRLIAEVMAPGAQVASPAEVATHSAVCVLAVPLHSLHELAAPLFDGRVLVDAINCWQPVDGPIERFGVAMADTTRLVQARFPAARLVKGLNQLGYHDIEDGSRPAGAQDRLGVAVAGDDDVAKTLALELVEALGFDAVDAGPLASAPRLGPGGPAFGAALSADDLRRALGLGEGL